MNLIFLFLLFFARIDNISSFLPEDAILTQTVKGDCTGDLKDEIIIVYDIDSRFGTEDYKGTCVTILKKIEKKYEEVYKSRLSADTKVSLVKVFDELPPFIEVQWFHSAGGGNIYIFYDKGLERFREIFNLESGGLKREDIDGDGKEETFAFTFKPLQCNGEEDEIFASSLIFYRWTKGHIESFPENPFMMRPGMTHFAAGKGITRPNLLVVSPKQSASTGYRGSKDLSFEFLSTIETSLLSITITVKDDVIVGDREGRIIFSDHIILLLDTELEKDFCRRFVDEDDIAMAISPGNFIDISPGIFNLNPSSRLSKKTINSADYLIEKQPGGYKACIKLELDESILRKELFGLGLILYDRDVESSGFPEFKLSWPTNINKKDPTTWGNLYLFRHY